MKEIDKIRIRQWNQDNPYIQMKNLENAQPGYRVHTVNDDHHLYELPLETQNIILDWVFWNFYPAQKIYPHLTSDDLKEVLYKRTQIHLYNNQFKEAMRNGILCLQKHCIRRTISNICLIFFCMVHWRNEKHLWQNRERRC